MRSLKNVCDRLERFHQKKGARWVGNGTAPLKQQARPLRDRAIVYVLLSTGLRREELVQLDLDQVSPQTVEDYVKRAKGASVGSRARVGRSGRSSSRPMHARRWPTIWSGNGHAMLGDDVDGALPQCGWYPGAAADGRLSARAINLVLEQIGRWHDAEFPDPARRIVTLRPHDLRHTFAFHLAKATGADAYELERRLGHRSQRYIQRYTNPPEAVAAAYIEEF